MTWRKASESTIGGNYTWYDAETDSPNLLPLLYCIGNAIHHVPFDFFFNGIFTGQGPCGGDPGWQLFRQGEEGKGGNFYAWTHPDTSGLMPHEGEYDEATVKLQLHRTLLNFLDANPDQKEEVAKVIEHYGLSCSQVR